MSLTSLLMEPSPLRTFFQETFPNTRPIISEVNNALADRGVLGVAQLSSGAAGLIGTAFDYRARFYFQNYDPIETVAALADLSDFAPSQRKLAAIVFKTLCDRAKTCSPAGRQLAQEEENLLNGVCLGLAYFEQFYRALFDVENSTLGRAIIGCRDPEDVVQQVCEQPELLKELRLLSEAFRARWENRLAMSTTLNPTFTGSADVGGADADMIIGGTLVDFKTSRQRRPCDREQLWQLAGYVLLDYDGNHPIETVALDFVRHDHTVEWPVDVLVSSLAGSRQPITVWRAQFRDVAVALSREVS